VVPFERRTFAQKRRRAALPATGWPRVVSSGGHA
jgi:hypothetical protein